MVNHGFFGYFKGLMPSFHIPLFVVPVMVIVELLGLFTKPFALCVRLFANMSAGHIVIFSLIGLIFIFHSVFVAPISIGFAVFISLLEILVGLNTSLYFYNADCELYQGWRFIKDIKNVYLKTFKLSGDSNA